MASDQEKRAYSAQRAAARVGTEAFTEALCTLLDDYGCSLADLVKTSHVHNGALSFGVEKLVYVPMIFKVEFGDVLDQERYDKFLENEGWNKTIIIDGEEEQ